MVNVVDISPTPFPTETWSSGCSGVKRGRLTRSICLVRNKAWRWCDAASQGSWRFQCFAAEIWGFSCFLRIFTAWTLLDIRDLYRLFLGFAICRVLYKLTFFPCQCQSWSILLAKSVLLLEDWKHYSMSSCCWSDSQLVLCWHLHLHSLSTHWFSIDWYSKKNRQLTIPWFIFTLIILNYP